MSISPAVRLLALILVFLALFFTAVTYSVTFASQSVTLNSVRIQANKEYMDRNSYRDEAAKKLNEELMVKSSTETMIRINNNEMIKLRNLKPENPNQLPVEPNQSKPIVAR